MNLAGMPMAGVTQSGQEAYRTHVASGVGTSQEGEAMILLSYVRTGGWPSSRECIGWCRTLKHWLGPSELTKKGATVGMACTTYMPRSWGAATTPSRWITDLNVRVDAAAQEPTEVDLTWLLRRPFSFLPPVAYRDHCQLSPTALSDWLQDHASVPARVGYEARWGANYAPGSGLPLDCFDSNQQHRMDNIPTMTVLAHRSSHRNTVLDTTCLLCGAQPETAPHLWACSAQSHEWRPARRQLVEWLDPKVGSRAGFVCNQLWEQAVLEQWAATLPTPSMQRAHMEGSGPHTLGTGFIRHVIEESNRVWYTHAKARATLLKAPLARTARWCGCCRSYARTSRRREREYSGNFWADSSRLVGDLQVSPTPLFPPITTHLHTTRPLDTRPSRLPVSVGRHPGHCLLVSAPSAQHNKAQHNATQHNTTQHNTTQHNTTQHNTTHHTTTQHNTTQHSTT